ncbi:hypothetical protein M2192_007634 [Bradyrhizobium elkanii USDA 61]|jgi:hypothetical protein|uniref:DUF1794 domain-containing protein n=1 Tax=Bradyrhizobium elkanii TaxID=29448 RepID=A0A8I2C4Y4_BRAEL|nr:hypothetical protein [Bradyrhizobium elkanii]MCS4010674.1 hypothetical protein [Bradyrhizobium elkanii USDA 61]MCP1925858.1 hypothetical protein [Bradyrhizobium elkanii]MCS3476650.1 hypothetical protein [Bradyrhizobium elkanii]MCS3566481.1 hypothetical protein [Bradyrhizobium elkanii]
MRHVYRLQIVALSVTPLIVVAQWSAGAQAQQVQSEPIAVQDRLPLGPLTRLIGVWTGTGIDTVPDSKGGSTRTRRASGSAHPDGAPAQPSPT